MQIRIKKWLSILIISLSTILVLRMIAPYGIQKIGNYVLNSTEGIKGEIGDIDLHIYRGAYVIENLTIRKEFGEQQQPLISVKRIDISVLWSALIRGSIVSEMSLLEPQLYILDTPADQSEENKQITNEDTWIDLVNKAVPFSIDHIQITDGTVTLRNLSDELDHETSISDINGQITNLTNSQEKKDELVAKFDLTAMLMGRSEIIFRGAIDPFRVKPSFDINIEMQKLPVKEIDTLLEFYAPFDLEAGVIDGALELVANQGKLNGYIKAGIYDLSVFSWHQDVLEDKDNPFQLVFEALTDLVSEVLENDKSELVATRIPISGTLDNTNMSTVAAIVATLRNAFIRAFEMNIEDSVEFKNTQNTQLDEESQDKQQQGK